MVKFQDSAVTATVGASDMSDIASRAAAMVWGSDPSSFSAASTMGSLVVKHLPDLSNIVSNTHADLEDLSNVVSNMHADLEDASNIISQILGDTTGLAGQDASGIASAVWSEKYNVYSAE